MCTCVVVCCSVALLFLLRQLAQEGMSFTRHIDAIGENFLKVWLDVLLYSSPFPSLSDEFLSFLHACLRVHARVCACVCVGGYPGPGPEFLRPDPWCSGLPLNDVGDVSETSHQRCSPLERDDLSEPRWE